MEKDYNILSQYGNEAKSFKRIDYKEEKRLSRLIQKGDMAARNKLVTSNLKLVIHIALMYKNKGIPYEDLVSEGNRGLIIAANKYDYKIGTKFSTFAYWQIREAITTSLKNEGKWLSLVEHEYLIDSNTNGSNYSNKSEGNEDLGILMIDKVALESFKIFTDNENNKNDDEDSNNEYKDVIMYLDELSPRESEIIKHYFGIEEREELNISELSKMYNISNVRISNIIDESIRKIRCKYLINSKF